MGGVLCVLDLLRRSRVGLLALLGFVGSTWPDEKFHFSSGSFFWGVFGDSFFPNIMGTSKLPQGPKDKADWGS